MFAHIWRFVVALLDWRTCLRILLGRPVVDVVFITNMRDEVDRKRFLGSWVPPEGHFNGPRYWFGNVAGRTRAINTVTNDLATPSGRVKAKKQFLAAAYWAERNGARVILLAAGTKRLFGPQGRDLKEMFPNIVFTIGDNGTAWLLCSEISGALRSAGFAPGAARVCVIGPTGHLGKAVVEHLVGSGYDVIGLCSRPESIKACGISACSNFCEVGTVDAVVACTHSDVVRLSADTVEALRKNGRKLLVVDVAEPSNMSRETYRQCRYIVVRQDAGNAYSPKLQYVLGAISYRMFRMTRGVVFGCFAEAMTLFAESKVGSETVRSRDWFMISKENIREVGKLFRKHGFGLPSPRCFGEKVDPFNLDI